ncbi:MAG: hypothetical protein QXN66_03510 [Thermoplasmatales archaeon]
MRKNWVIVGIALLIVGAIMVSASLTQVERSFPFSQLNMTSTGNGYFISPAINVSQESEIIISSSSTSYLIPSKDISLLNSTNIESYGMHPYLTEGNSSAFLGASGVYYVAVPGNVTPVVRYGIVSSSLGPVVLYGLLLIVGVILIIAGIVIAVIGLFLKKKAPLNRI